MLNLQWPLGHIIEKKKIRLGKLGFNIIGEAFEILEYIELNAKIFFSFEHKEKRTLFVTEI